MMIIVGLNYKVNHFLLWILLVSNSGLVFENVKNL